MQDEQEMHADKDIQNAMEQASQLSDGGENIKHAAMKQELSDTLTATKCCPLLKVRYVMAKCALVAERNPWQTLAALSLAIGCGWLCWYFGATVLACLVLYAAYTDD